MGVYAFAGRGSALARTAFRSVLLGGGALAAIVLTAGAAHADSGTGVTATYTGPASPVSGDPLTWDVAGSNQLSCELDLAGASSPAVALGSCSSPVSYQADVAGDYTLRVWGTNPQAVNSSAPDATSAVAVAPATPQPTAPQSPSNNRSPQWVLGLPAGSTGSCTVTDAAGATVASANPCTDPWTSALGDSATSGVYTLSVTATAGGVTSAAGTASYSLDVDPPSPVTVTAPAPARDNNRQPAFTVSEPDTDVSYTCTVSGVDGSGPINGGSAVPVAGCGTPTTSLDLKGVPDGTWTLTVDVSDAAGNVVSGHADYTLDTTPPPAPTVSTPPVLTNATSVTLTISDTDPTATLTCTLTEPKGTKILDAAACPADGVFDTSNFGDGTYTLVVTAADDLGNTVDTTRTWSRDTTPPTQVTVTAPAKSTDNNRTPTFTVTEPDSGVTYGCTVSGGPSAVTTTSCGPSTVVDLSQAKDGTYRLTVVVKDAAGNTSSAYADYTLDTTPPTTPQIQAPKSPSNDRAPTFTVTEPDPGVTLACTVNGPSTVATPTPCGLSISVDLSKAKDGDYTLTVTASDAVGNTSSASVVYSLDTTPPAAPVLGTVAAATADTVVTVSITEADAAVVTCTLTGPGSATVLTGDCPADGRFDTTGFLDGTFQLTVTATDAAGNPATSTTSWLRDTIAPPAPDVTGPAADTNLTKPTVSVGDDETAATLTCSLTVPGTATPIALTGCPTTIDTSAYGDGIYRLVVTATDEVGNTSTTTVSWLRDTVAPPPPSVTQPRTPTNQTQLPMTIGDTESGLTFSCVLTVPGDQTVAYAACPATIDTTAYGDGTYSFAVTAADGAGNTTTTTVQWLRDTLPPPAPTVSTPATPTNALTVTLSIADGEKGTTLTCSLVGPTGPVLTGGCPATGVFDTTAYGDGLYTLTVTATDAAGNASSTSVSWTRDTVAPPPPAVSGPAASPGQSRTPGFGVSDSEAGVTYSCVVTGPATVRVRCGPAAALDLSGAPDGTYTLTVTAADAAGNVSAPGSATYTLDTTPPTAPTVTATKSPSQSRSPTFAISGIESGGVLTCSVSGPAGASVGSAGCSTSVGLSLAGQLDGTYTLSVTVTDAAGNVSPAGTASYVLDTTPPAAPTVVVPASPGNDLTPTLGITDEPGATYTCTVARFFQPVGGGSCTDGTVDLTGLVDGEFEITVVAIDAAGNTSPGTTVTYVLDTVAPAAPTLTAPASPSPVIRPIWLWTVAEDGLTGTCTVTSESGTVVQGPVACTGTFTGAFAGLPDGTYTLTVVLADAAGNHSAPASAAFVLDRQAPVPPAVTPPASPGSTLHPQWEISSPRGAQLTCTLTRGRTTLFGPGACPANGVFSLAGQPDGTYTLTVTATDSAGNVSAASVTTYVLDTVAPSMPRLVYAAPSPSYDTSPYWQFALPDGTTGRCQLVRDGSVLDSKQCSAAVTFDLTGRPAGTYTVVIVAVDAAGNVSAPLQVDYALGHPSPVTAAGLGGSGPTVTGVGHHSRRGGSGPAGLTAGAASAGIVQQTLAKLDALTGSVRSHGSHAVHEVATQAVKLLPEVHDRITQNVSAAVQNVVDAVSQSGGGAGFPLLLVFVVLAFLVVQNRIDRRDPKLALASVAADDTVEFVSPPSRGGRG